VKDFRPGNKLDLASGRSALETPKALAVYPSRVHFWSFGEHGWIHPVHFGFPASTGGSTDCQIGAEKSSLAMTERMGWPKTRRGKPFSLSVWWLVVLVFSTCELLGIVWLGFPLGRSNIKNRNLRGTETCVWPEPGWGRVIAHALPNFLPTPIRWTVGSVRVKDDHLSARHQRVLDSGET